MTQSYRDRKVSQLPPDIVDPCDVFLLLRGDGMKDYWTIKETSEHWNLSIRRISTLCAEGRIKGAFQFGRVWAIPAGTKKPKDERIKSGKYIKKKDREI